MPYGVPYGGRGGGRAARRPGSRRRARGGAVSARLGRLTFELVSRTGLFGKAVSLALPPWTRSSSLLRAIAASEGTRSTQQGQKGSFALSLKF